MKKFGLFKVSVKPSTQMFSTPSNIYFILERICYIQVEDVSQKFMDTRHIWMTK